MSRPVGIYASTLSRRDRWWRRWRRRRVTLAAQAMSVAVASGLVLATAAVAERLG